MNKNLIFKKLEVIGVTKDAAKESAPVELMVDATQAFNKWKETHTTSDSEVKEWMKTYLANKKFDRAGLGAYIVLQSHKLDNRERPYKETKVKHEARTHSWMKSYVIRDKETNTEVGCEKTYKAASQVAKEWVAENHESVNIFVEAKLKENNALYSTIDYTPSAGTRPCKLLVFGYVNAED